MTEFAPDNTPAKKENLLILGIGNILLGDEGVGVHAVRELENMNLPAYISLLDGGTGGFHLLSYLQDYKKVILIDATLDGKKAGTVSIIKPRYSNEFPRTLSSHDIGLKDLIESASLLGKLPEIILITISVNPEQSLTMELSEEISESVSKVIKEVQNLISAI